MTWRERIAAARERRTFSSEDRALAANWTTCAVGEAHRVHPLIVRYTNCDPQVHEIDSELGCGVPVDRRLEYLGDYAAGFLSAVKRDQIGEAETRLDQIEDRVLELKRDL